MNFQMFKLDLRIKFEIKFPTSDRPLQTQENYRKTSVSALLTMPKPLTVWLTTNWKILKEMGIPDHLYGLEKPVCRSGSNNKNWTWNNRLVPNQERSTSRLYIVTVSRLLI